MADERCPWCGAEATHRFGRIEYRCGSYPEEQSPICARVTRLESALRCIRQYGPFKSFTWIDRTIDEALADTHGPGTIAGDAAREGLTP